MSGRAREDLLVDSRWNASDLRWILLSLDRLPRNELTMTQKMITGMLGVRREGIMRWSHGGGGSQWNFPDARAATNCSNRAN